MSPTLDVGPRCLPSTLDERRRSGGSVPPMLLHGRPVANRSRRIGVVGAAAVTALVAAGGLVACSGSDHPERGGTSSSRAASTVRFVADPSGPKPSADDWRRLLTVFRNRLDAMGVAATASVADGRLVVAPSRAGDRAKIVAAATARGTLEFRPVLDGPIFPSDPTTTLPPASLPPASLAPATFAPTSLSPPAAVVAPTDTGRFPGTIGTGREVEYLLGPAALDGTAIETAHRAKQVDPPSVEIVFRPGIDGIGRFNRVAAMCFDRAETCPTSQLAIVLDGRVLSAPMIQLPEFERDQIQISGDFDEQSANALAASLRSGSLPIKLVEE